MLRTSEAPPSVSYHSAVSHQPSLFVSANGPCHRVCAGAEARESTCQSRTFPLPQARHKSQKKLPVNSTPKRIFRCLRPDAVDTVRILSRPPYASHRIKRNDLVAPQSGHASNFCGLIRCPLEPRKSIEQIQLVQARQHVIHAGHPVWTRLELAKGAQGNFRLRAVSDRNRVTAQGRRLSSKPRGSGCNRRRDW